VEEERDGRRRRSAASKQKIVEAMLELVRSGVTAPSADVVAERAGVGRRTVFRLFNDMDSIYHEMHMVMRQRVAVVLQIPVRGETPAARLAALIDRRVRFFEEVLPVAVAAAVHRPYSAFLQADHAAIAAELRGILAAHLEADVQADPVDMEALDAVLCIEMWRRLRIDQKLAAPLAAAVLKRTALAVLETRPG
jgi:AcrR family transcriptional regulator